MKPSTPLLCDLRTVASAIRAYRFTYGNESDLQEGVEAAFLMWCLPSRREVRLSGTDRVDFLVGSVAVEVKTKGSLTAVLAQLQRYAHHQRIGALVLVTTCVRHRGLPTVAGTKPLEVVHIGVGL